MITDYQSNAYRISYQGVSMTENALENPNLIQVGVVPGCTIMVAPQKSYGIDYLPNGEYRSWTLTGYNTRLNRTEAHYIYARLERGSDDAMVLFSVNDYATDGSIGGENPSEDFYYIRIGSITATDSLEGATLDREITLDYGKLSTPEGNDQDAAGWKELFELTAEGLIRPLKRFTSYIVQGTLSIIGKLVINDKQITDVARQGDDEEFTPNDEAIPTTKLLTGKYLKYLRSFFLNKDREDSTQFLQKFLGGIILPFIQSEEFTSGPLGSGFTLKTNADKTTYLEVDKMLIRMKAVFQVLEILKTELGGASFLFNASGARATITKVEKLEQEVYFIDDEKGYFSNGDEAYFPDVYRCFFSTDDGDTAIENLFKVGDFIRSQTFNIKAGVHENVQNHYWWRKVVGTGDDYIDLSSVDFASDSDIPQEGDVIVQLGNDRDTDRQSAILLSAYGDNAPYFTMYQGIDSYSLSGKEIFTVYYDSVEKECVLRIGREGEKGYLRYSSSKGLIVECSIEVLGGSGVSNFDDALEFSEQINDRMSQYLGYDGWESMVTEALAGRTIIKGGVINTSLINVDSLFAGEIYAGNATISEGTFKKINVEEATISNSTLTEVNVTGTINANAGYIGGFKIENSRLSYNYSDNNKTSPSIIINVDTNESFRINENPTSNGPFMQIRSQKRSAIDIFTGGGYEDDPSAIRVTCNAKGYGKAIESYGNVQMTARDSENIKISGLALNVRLTSSSETLTSGDDVIISTSDRNITLNLPYNLGKKDKIIWIRKSGLGNITVSGNGLSIKGNNEFGNGGWHDSVEIANGQLWMFFCTGGVWFANCLT